MRKHPKILIISIPLWRQTRHNYVTIHSLIFHGRNHFFLRSGRALMVIQSDKADVGPAIHYWLFDAGTPKQSGKKVHAFNFNPQARNNFSSTLKAIIKNVPFMAFGEQTPVHWVEENGIPTIEGLWYADGVRITERFTGLPEKEIFQRAILLEGTDLSGELEITLRLNLPFGNCQVQGRRADRKGW